MYHKKEKKSEKPIQAFSVTEKSELLPFLLAAFPEKPRGKIKSLLTHKLITVDGKIQTRHDTPLKPGQTIELHPYEPVFTRAELPLEILYEDHDLIAINKPAGLLSIGTDREKERTAYHMINEYVQATNPDSRIFVLHRLDQDTSGVLMAAKDPQLKDAMQKDWNKLVTDRGYTAVVEGQVEKPEGHLCSWLLETKTHLMYSSSTPGDGQKAITNYRVVKQGRDYALVELNLETGRKNQIRVHMKDLGNPVAGDKRYGALSNPFKRLMLHAHRLTFTHPFTGESMTIEAPVPKKWVQFSLKRAAEKAVAKVIRPVKMDKKQEGQWYQKRR